MVVDVGVRVAIIDFLSVVNSIAIVIIIRIIRNAVIIMV